MSGSDFSLQNEMMNARISGYLNRAFPSCIGAKEFVMPHGKVIISCQCG
jgi:hypothetical protein